MRFRLFKKVDNNAGLFPEIQQILLSFTQTKLSAMKSFKKLLSVILVLLCSLTGFSQKQKINGTVTDASTGAPVDGASIHLKASGGGTISNGLGAFSIEASGDDVLTITSVGYTIQTIPLKGQTYISVKLQPAVTELGQIVMVGSRSGGRVKTESPVPIDVISLSTTSQITAKSDLTSLLNTMAPSFNYNKQSGGDGADAIDLATLRGLGPDQTLVLINGKRQHQTAFVALFGTRGRGNSGTDLNAIPESAIDHVEILRDGASAQYGSDAIAGVINIVLKKNVNHLTINTGISGYNDHKYNSLNSGDPSQFYNGHKIDGVTGTIGLNYGLAVGKQDGFINFSGNFLNQGKTFRQAPVSSPLGVNYVRRAFGDASVTSGGIVINSEIPIAGTKTKFYSFGMYNYKNSNAYAYTRQYGSRPNRFPVNSDGTLNYDGSIMHKSKDGTIFYNPLEDVHITDVSWAVGLKGDWANDWSWDVSNTIGYNNFHYFGQKTFNASQDTAGMIPQTSFNDGGFSLFQNSFNADVNKHYAHVAQGFNLSFGVEGRYEKYKIYAGEPASYLQYVQTDINYPGDITSPASGAQGFPGFQPSDAEATSNAHRTNIAGYVEGELDVTKEWLIDGAIRAEDYSDFGGVSTFKLATRYKVSNNFNLRGSISTGFRAPSLQQIYFSNTETNVQAGVPTQVQIIPNANPIAKAAGIPNLKPEKSTNASVGFSWKPAKNLTVTVDGYMVKIKDRVVLTGEFSTSDTAISQALIANHVDDAQFFANAINTTNWGLDVVVDYRKHWGKNTLGVLLAGNVQNLTIDKINVPPALADNQWDALTFFDQREQDFVKASAPPEKFNLSLDYGHNKWSAGVHFTYFGKIVLLGYGDGSSGDYSNGFEHGDVLAYVPSDANGLPVRDQYNYTAKMTTDIFVSYKFAKSVTGYIGADNIFNVHPDYGYVKAAAGWDYNNETGGAWDAVQMGFNGMRMFARLAFNF